MKRIFTIIVLLLLGIGLRAQGVYSTDREAFFDELSTYLNSSTSKTDREDAAVLMTRFHDVWNQCRDSQRIIQLFEGLRSKSGQRAYFNTFTLVEVLCSIQNNGMTADDVQRWLTYTEKRFAKRASTMDKYLKACSALFAQGVLSEHGLTQWTFENATYHFPTDTAFLLDVPSCTLILKSKKDQSVIHNTSGFFDMDNHSWTGKEGRVDWGRFDIPSDMVYGLVHDYTINLSSSNYTIENIDFFNRYFFDHPFSCSYEDNVTNSAPTDRTMFPKALSHTDSYETGKVFDNVLFIGGFGLVGKSANVFGSNGRQAQFIYQRENRPVMSVKASRFVMVDDNLVSNEASARIYLYDSASHSVDSIYHNDLGFRFDNAKQTLMLYRKDNGVGAGPFHDTYHEFDIFLEAVYWDMNSDVMEFRRLEGTNGVSEGVISSVNYFRRSDYLKIQALDNKHPMELINNFLRVYGDESNKFNINDLSSFLKYPLPQVTTMVMNLQAEGYLEYDRNTQVVSVLDRFFDVLASEHNQFDYDVIKFQTRTTNRQPNLRLVLTTNDMLVYGISNYQVGLDVASITLSDYKHVLILPDNARVTLKKHRNFNFSGCVMAGMYEFFTKDCLFDYETFSIQMNKVDSLRFYSRFDNKVYPVEGTLERMSGLLEIDEGDNKSSVRHTPDYPVFHSKTQSYKFYRTINDGVFDVALDRDTVTEEQLQGHLYYLVEPFTVRGLDALDSKDVRFEGRLISGGILPDIVEPLVVMDDHSLGFEYQIGNGSSDSYPLYGGLGQYHQNVHLSNDGFYGKGRVDVETSEYLSDRFVFYLDSVTAHIDAFTMRERSSGVQFPKAQCGQMELKWDITIPQLYTTTNDEPICLYDSTYFYGKTMLSDEGFRGDGMLSFGLTRFQSEDFDFASSSFVADSSNFVLFDEDGKTEAFLATNYRSHVNLKTKTSEFEYLDGNSRLGLPLNKFYCSLRQATWNMDDSSVHLFSMDEGGKKSKFVSLLPEHDSLSFLCTNADYDMERYVIHAHEVKEIHVADASIQPLNQNLDILRDAVISPLEHSVICADTVNGYHTYKDVAVSIYSRHDYRAIGIKDYRDLNDVATPVFYDSIVPVDGITTGYAVIPDTMEFQLSPVFGFKGSVVSSANESDDFFEGDFRMISSCSEDTVWFASSGRMRADSIAIPVQMATIRRDNPEMMNGLSYVYAGSGVYKAAFMEPLPGESQPVPLLEGSLKYDSCFVVVDDERSDRWVRQDDRCVVTGHERTNLGFDAGLANFECYGTYTAYPNDSMVLDVVQVLNLPIFDEQTLKDIAELYAAVEGPSVNLHETEFLSYLQSEKGEEAAGEMAQEIELTGYPEIRNGSFYNQTLVLPTLHLVWNSELKAFVSTGKIAIGNLGRNVVNKYVDGTVVFDKRLGIITYYFENDMFMTYMSYNCGDRQFQIHATWGDVNVRLSDMKEKNRRVRKDGQEFEYVVTPYEAMTDFLSRLKRAGLR